MLLKLATWNVNGIRAILKKGNLLNYISQSSPDIICLNEIRIDEHLLGQSEVKTSFANFPYQIWSCSEKKGYSGVAILSKLKPLNFYWIFQNDLKFDKSSFKGRLAIMEFNTCYLVSVYSPNAGTELKNLGFRIDIWEKYLRSSLHLLPKKIILCGDLNVAFSEIDIFNPKGSKNKPGFTDKERENFGILLKEGFTDCFRKKYPLEIKYTWWSPRNKLARLQQKGWRLDYFLVKGENHEFVVKDCQIRDDILGSDHCPVEMFIDSKEKDF